MESALNNYFLSTFFEMSNKRQQSEPKAGSGLNF